MPVTRPTRLAAALLASALFASNGLYAAHLTRDNGAPVGDNQHSQTAGAAGPVLLQDVQLIQKLHALTASASQSVWCMPAALAPTGYSPPSKTLAS